MDGSFLKGFCLCILGLLLWVIYSFVAAFSPGEYGPHILMGLSFTLMVFGPVLFWIVFPLKERWYDKDKKKRFYVTIAPIVLIFLIFLGVVFSPPEAPEAVLSSVTTEAVDHEGTTSMKVTLKGQKDSYHLTLSGPENNTVDTAYVTSSDMADGREAIWISMADYKTQAKAGTYTLIIEVFMGNEVYENEFTYSGPNLTVESWGTPAFTHLEYMGYYLKNLSVTVSNNGDLPAYMDEMKVIVGGEKGTGYFYDNTVSAGETTTLEGNFYIGPFEEGSYTATYVLLETRAIKPSVVLATHSTNIQIP